MRIADTRTVVFAAVFGASCALILTIAGRLAAPHWTANEKAEEIRNYLSALGVPFEKKTSAQALIKIFESNVIVQTNGTLPLYAFITNGTSEIPVAFAVPLAGMGLWGPIKGVLALEPDLQTIRALRFYQQEETPGLGGEIGSEWFVNQFKGKKIVSATGEPGIRLLKKGATLDENSVDAITGATMTSDRVQSMLRDAAAKVTAERSRRYGPN